MYLYPYTYISELLFSFVPYALVINSIIGLISLYKTIQSSSIYKKIIRSIICICYIVPLGSQIQDYHDSYDNTNNPLIESQKSVWLSFFYANIYYQNKNLSWLIETIQRDDPDIILLVEYTREQNEVLSSSLRSTHPYVSRYIWKEWYDGDVIYSKYPLEKIKHTVYPGSFSHISITYDNKQVDFALIHTSTPVLPTFFHMRNKQLNDLSMLLWDYYKRSQIDKNIILLWDFNITPRSQYYRIFDTTMNSLWLYNLSTDTQSTYYESIVPYTRCHQYAKMFCAHIDHIWSNIPIQLKRVTAPWSDHYGFVGEI
jgi:endonuclease/exonuclease/phosphatase (EEP) superfamily protein YafD